MKNCDKFYYNFILHNGIMPLKGENRILSNKYYQNDASVLEQSFYFPLVILKTQITRPSGVKNIYILKFLTQRIHLNLTKLKKRMLQKKNLKIVMLRRPQV